LRQRGANEQQAERQREVRRERRQDQQDVRWNMGEHHRVDQADAPGQPRRDRIGKRAERRGPEEKQAGRRQRQVEALEQPEREQRLHDKAAGKGIQEKQRR
jgi:hypothetical protein